ncbi:hypothetical protein [Paenibacillus macquariensis]|uniref:hypothetical protein n=2 Tax=Paenibacillus macquariensis TaxID=948756 RepID=UPI002DBA7052|nr:hypothetical protein [Paenibacillus macquariensis]MEC0090700.1 hypothetical protein [Paenibacillus macquariensis]
MMRSGIIWVGIYFELTADIDLSGDATGEGWKPIGGGIVSMFQGNSLTMTVTQRSQLPLLIILV